MKTTYLYIELPLRGGNTSVVEMEIDEMTTYSNRYQQRLNRGRSEATTIKQGWEVLHEWKASNGSLQIQHAPASTSKNGRKWPASLMLTIENKGQRKSIKLSSLFWAELVTAFRNMDEGSDIGAAIFAELEAMERLSVAPSIPQAPATAALAVEASHALQEVAVAVETLSGVDVSDLFAPPPPALPQWSGNLSLEGMRAYFVAACPQIPVDQIEARVTDRNAGRSLRATLIERGAIKA